MSPVYLNPSPPSTIPFLDIKENHHQLLVNQNSNNHDHLMANLQHVEGLSIDHFSNQPSRIDKEEVQHQLKFKHQLQGGESSNSDGVVPLLSVHGHGHGHGHDHGHQGNINTCNDVGSADHYHHSNLYGSVPALSSSLDIHSSRGSSTSSDQDENNKLAFETVSRSSFSHPPSPPPNNTSKWMPSKARMMQKMMMSTNNSNNNSRPIVRIRHRHRLQQQDINNNSNVRQCSDCRTTTTPLWRSGPQGPKTLCNACGIRQRKARQAMAAAAAAAGSGSSSSTTGINSPQTQGSSKANDINVNKLFTMQQHKADHKLGSSSSDHHNNKSSSNSHHHHLLPYKKRGKQIINNNHTKKLSFEDFFLSLSNSLGSTANRVFPQDEEEAAILLMALSCGLA